METLLEHLSFSFSSNNTVTDLFHFLRLYKIHCIPISQILVTQVCYVGARIHPGTVSWCSHRSNGTKGKQDNSPRNAVHEYFTDGRRECYHYENRLRNGARISRGTVDHALSTQRASQQGFQQLASNEPRVESYERHLVKLPGYL